MLEGVFVLLFIAVALFVAALYIKEPILAIFSSFMLLLGGFSVITTGFGTLTEPYTLWFGILLLTLGAYIAIKAGLDIMGVTE